MSMDGMVSPANLMSGSRAVIKPWEYMILPEDSRCSTFQPNLRGGKAQILATPQLGARFVAYELWLETGGGTIAPIQDSLEHFFFVIEGGVEMVAEGVNRTLSVGAFAALPPAASFEIKGTEDTTRIFWLRRRYEELENVQQPTSIFGIEESVAALPEGDIYPEQRLIPRSPSSDMAFNIIHVEPGSSYSIVESHAWEHAMYMLDGEGLLALNGTYHHVKPNDFIYIAPYCPEFFCALGKEGDRVRFLLYWDTMREYSLGL